MASRSHNSVNIAAGVILALLVAACGGGGSGADAPAPAAPSISVFSADRDRYFVGESAQLTVRYAGGAGRIEPDVGPVADCARVSTPPLSQDRAYRLIVEGPNGRAIRELALAVSHRDRYANVGTLLSVQHAAVALDDGAVLIIGGSRGEGVLSHRITRFDPAGPRLTEIGLLQVGRADHRATLLADGSVLVTGGETSLADGQRIERIDPRSGNALAAGELVVKRSSHTATRLADGRVLIAGGYAAGGQGVLDRAELWDPATQTARLLPARMSTPRAAHTATRLADGRVLLFGGLAPSDASYALAEIYDPQREAFTPVSAPGGMRLLHAALPQADGSVLIVGGERFDPVTGTTEPLADMLRFDATRGRIEPAGTLLGPRSAVVGAAVGERVLLFGGLGAGDARLARAEIIAIGQPPRALAPLPGERAWHTATRLPDGRILIVGGEDPGRHFVPDVLLYE